MPRIPASLLRKARAIDVFLPPLLATCRDLPTAQNELRWLREHVQKVARARRARGDVLARNALLGQLVQDRARGKPLQYILGTEWFGDLEIGCRKGVLIPRQDTAASVTHLVRLLRDAPMLPPELRVLDLCTGTGCIPLLFRHEMYATRGDVDLRILGVDVSDKALRLAARNVWKVRKSMKKFEWGQLQLMNADILINPFADQIEGPLPLKTALNHHGLPAFWDVLISNPPYVSPKEYWKTTTRSVRHYEPKLALVPPPKAGESDNEQGDMFYPRLFKVAEDIEAKIVLLEVADLEQALRVARRARDLDIYEGVEIWREDPRPTTDSDVEEDGFSIIGDGNARSVLCWRGAGTSWLGKTTAAVTSRTHNNKPGAYTEKSMEAYFDPTLVEDSSSGFPLATRLKNQPLWLEPSNQSAYLERLERGMTTSREKRKKR
jgi:methylase of polypeptide subunit release factors